MGNISAHIVFLFVWQIPHLPPLAIDDYAVPLSSFPLPMPK